MALSAKDIDERKFPVVRRGYDIPSVDDLLDRLAAKIHRIECELDVLRSDQQQTSDRERDFRASIDQLRVDLDAALAETAEAERHTEQTRQMFDRDLRDRAVQIRQLQQQLAECQRDLAANDQQRAAQIEESNERVRAAQTVAEEARRQVADLGRRHDEDRRALRGEIDGLRRQLAAAREDAAHLAARQAPLETASHALREQVAELAALITGFREDTDGRRTNAVDQLGQLDAGLEALQRRVEASDPPDGDQAPGED